MQVSYLECGDLFIWEMHPYYMHQMTNEVDADTQSPIANHIATKDDNGKWRFHEPRGQKWNPYCPVKVFVIG